MSSLIQESKRLVYKSKIEEEKDDRKSIWKLFKEFGATSTKCNENDCLKIKVGVEIISNDFDLAERFNDYFINVEAYHKTPIEQSNFDDLREHTMLNIPENVVFKLPEIDENFVFKYLSTLGT